MLYTRSYFHLCNPDWKKEYVQRLLKVSRREEEREQNCDCCESDVSRLAKLATVCLPSKSGLSTVSKSYLVCSKKCASTVQRWSEEDWANKHGKPPSHSGMKLYEALLCPICQRVVRTQLSPFTHFAVKESLCERCLDSLPSSQDVINADRLKSQRTANARQLGVWATDMQLQARMTRGNHRKLQIPSVEVPLEIAKVNAAARALTEIVKEHRRIERQQRRSQTETKERTWPKSNPPKKCSLS